MGLLTEGSPLSWEETKKQADHVRKQGIRQFINIFKRHKDRKDSCFYWGDEIEYMIVQFDDVRKTAKVCLKAEEALNSLQHNKTYLTSQQGIIWMPEFCSYMLEGTPGRPYHCILNGISAVEENMKLRKKEIQRVLGCNEVPICLASFPRLGVGQFCNPDPILQPDNNNGVGKSIYLPDAIYAQGHPRYSTFSKNTRERKGRRFEIQVPIYKDTKTILPFVEDFRPLGDDGEAERTAKPDHIYMDSNAFGGGCCALHVTVQASDIDEARLLYDQLTPMCPLMIAVSAAAPIFKGYLSDVDSRWSVLSQAFDARTDEEKGNMILQNGSRYIPKSRCDIVNLYLTPKHEVYNDTEVVVDQEIYKTLQRGGVDDTLAKHIAYLFIRDPIVLYQEYLKQDDEKDTDHFENIQSTNWHSLRFKPPPNNSTGWRIEIRPMEVQLSSFENAAYCVFMVLLTRVILSYGLNLIMPISEVDENMKTACKRDAVNQATFYFRKDIFTNATDRDVTSRICIEQRQKVQNTETDNEYCKMSADEIFNGSDTFPGLIPLIQMYVNNLETTSETGAMVNNYLELISNRASGKQPTIAKSIRNFVITHPDYKHESVVSEVINYDLLKHLVEKTKSSE